MVNGAGIIAILQFKANAYIKGPDIDRAFISHNLTKENSSQPLPYLVFKTNVYSWIYFIYCSFLMVVGNAAVAWMAFVIVKTLRAHAKNMSAHTYSLNKQINNLLFIQVRAQIS